ncbi:HD domain-containing protein [bacterium]|nr:HD domain-containing protein [bacterium]
MTTDLNSAVASIILSASSSAEVKLRISEQRESLIAGQPPENFGLALSYKLTEFYNAVIQAVFERFSPDIAGKSLPFCIMAVGGFGRNELNIYSDIDINFIYSARDFDTVNIIKEKVHGIVKYLWDVGLEIGHSMRSSEECLYLSKQDIDIKTSFIESRLLCGDADCFDNFRRSVWNDLLGDSYEQYIQSRLISVSMRHEQFGNSERVLEPHVKEGEGGLRDIHVCYWTSQVWLMKNYSDFSFSGHESQSLKTIKLLIDKKFLPDRYLLPFTESFEFLHKTRNFLHCISGRRNDILAYPLQAKVATMFPYVDENEFPGVEQFMQDYYRHTRVISNAASLIGDKLRSSTRQAYPDEQSRTPVENGFYIANDKLHYDGDILSGIGASPHLMMSVFSLVQKYRVQPSEPIQYAIRENIDRVDESFRTSAGTAHDFMQLWHYEGQVASILKLMHDLGFLERYIPEFGYIVAHYNYNIYHAYTTDEHLIVTLSRLEALFYEDGLQSDAAYKHLQEIYQELSLFEKYQLYWAVFLHDIGKSRGGDHSEIGVDLAKQIFLRLGYKDPADAVYFLILHHLTMEQLAFRRNLKDSETIAEFARLIQNRRWLRMLYLLTYADVAAARKNVWTEWKGILLQELFIKADHYLKTLEEPGSTPAFDWEEIDYGSITLSDDLQITFNDRSNFSEILVVTTDYPYRLSQICGAMSVCDIGIFEANVYTRKDGVIIDQFRVTAFGSDTPLSSVQKQKMETILRQVLTGSQEIEPQIEKLKTRWKRKKFLPSSETEIYFEDNRKFTIIDIFTADRIGLLYIITRTLSDLKLNIYSAKIGTRLDGAADCFYVLDTDGNKITSIERQEEIRDEIMRKLSS